MDVTGSFYIFGIAANVNSGHNITNNDLKKGLKGSHAVGVISSEMPVFRKFPDFRKKFDQIIVCKGQIFRKFYPFQDF